MSERSSPVGDAGSPGVPEPAEAATPRAEPAHLSITVRDHQNNKIALKIKSTTKFGKVFNVFCGRQGVNMDTCRFTHDGERLTTDDTPVGRDMEDGDIIQVFQEQIGGAAVTDASPSPPPRAPTAMTPGPRAVGYLNLYNKTLSHTLATITYEHFAACFPNIAEKAPAQLKHLHKAMIEKLAGFAKTDFELITQERSVISNLNALEDLIETARRRSARSTDSANPPTPAHLLPASQIMSATLSSLHASQQSQLNAKLQTVESQNASLARAIAEQQAEIENLLKHVETVVSDLDAANAALESEVEGLARDARVAEGNLINA